MHRLLSLVLVFLFVGGCGDPWFLVGVREGGPYGDDGVLVGDFTETFDHPGTLRVEASDADSATRFDAIWHSTGDLHIHAPVQLPDGADANLVVALYPNPEGGCSWEPPLAPDGDVGLYFAEGTTDTTRRGTLTGAEVTASEDATRVAVTVDAAFFDGPLSNRTLELEVLLDPAMTCVR
ncbi:MAG: hypothetical protein AB8I08_16395 [Sandaracinaceae bacterium]